MSEVRWHGDPSCVDCERNLRDGETVYPVSGQATGLLCVRCVRKRIPMPGNGRRLAKEVNE